MDECQNRATENTRIGFWSLSMPLQDSVTPITSASAASPVRLHWLATRGFQDTTG